MKQRARFSMLALVIATTCACGGSDKKVETVPAMTVIEPPKDKFTAAVRKRSEVAKRVPTSGVSPLDTDVLEKMIGTRLREVTERVLRDVMVRAMKAISSKPARDLVRSFASLVLRQADQEARSQTVITAMLRSGLSAGFAALANEVDALRGKCGGTDEGKRWPALLDTAYEALASTDALGSLGWTEAEGKIPAGCEAMQKQIVQIVELGARVHTDFEPAKLEADARGVAAACNKGNVTLQLPAAGQALRMSDFAFFAAQLNRVLAAPDHACRMAANEFVNNYVRPLTNVIGAAGEQLSLAELAASIKALRDTFAKVKQWHAKTRPLLAIVRKLIEREKLGRDDIVSLSRWLDETIGPRVDELSSDRAKKLIHSAIDELPNLFREDETSKVGIKVDVPGLVSTVTSTLLKDEREGLYLRASVGSGYIGVGDDTESAFYEELGAGYRWSKGEFLFGPHAITSGLLYSTVSQSGTLDDHAFVGAGLSLNMYRLLDVSASIGWMVDIEGDTDSDFTWMVGLQVPLYDYLSALGSGTK